MVNPWLDVKVRSLNTELASNLEYKGTEGALVADVLSGNPAAQAGLRQGNIIVKLPGLFCYHGYGVFWSTVANV